MYSNQVEILIGNCSNNIFCCVPVMAGCSSSSDDYQKTSLLILYLASDKNIHFLKEINIDASIRNNKTSSYGKYDGLSFLTRKNPHLFYLKKARLLGGSLCLVTKQV